MPSIGCLRRWPTRPGGRWWPGWSEKESLTVSELAQPFPVSLPAIMKHLDVLSDAGLISAQQERPHA